MPVTSRDGEDWTHEEIVFALGLYFQIPWGKINQRNPVVIAAAELLGRTPGALGRKMGNLGHFLTTAAYNQHFALLDNRTIELPSRGKPAKEFLEYHNDYVFVA